MGDGFYLAVPADATLRERVDQLAAGQSPTHRRLGVSIAPAHVARRLRRAVGLPERDGLLVRGVEDGSPAAAAGITTGDLIVSAGGRDVGTADDLLGRPRRARHGGRHRPRHRARRRRADRPRHLRGRDGGDGGRLGLMALVDDDAALDAYSATVVAVAERLLPSVASLQVGGRSPGRRLGRRHLP